MSVDTSEKNFEASIEATLLRDPLSSAPQDKSALAEVPTGAYLSGGYRRFSMEAGARTRPLACETPVR